MTGIEERRTRWHCRRGLLELDLILDRFMERDYAGLDAEGRRRFDALLELPDNDLLDLLVGRQEPPAQWAALVRRVAGS